MSPQEGEIPDPVVYVSADDVGPCTVKAVERCLQRVFDIADIAIVSLRRRERFLLQGLGRLGDGSLRGFTGRYDEGGGAIWTEGGLLIDSVCRFKGQASGAIVLTECDLVQLLRRVNCQPESGRPAAPVP